MIPSAQNCLEQRNAKRRFSMSLKFAALGSLTVLSALGTPARADDKAQNLGPVGHHEPILITFGHSSSEVGSEKLKAEPPAYHRVETQVR
jgi:hypothetical protein